MILTAKQEEGLRIALDRYHAGEKFTVISGYAGTGKSTLVRFIIDALNIDEEDVVYTAFTGKAAEVLHKKGNRNAMTLHKLLYDSFPKGDGTFFKKPKALIGYKFIVVDEVSMASKDLIDLLFSYKNIYVICLGDPFQLPTIDPNSDNHWLDHPHIFLDEIMRQAAESEIIRVSMDIRAMKPLVEMHGNEVQVFNKADLNTGMLMWADQVLVGINGTRIASNNQMRSLLGRGNMPEDGDKVICLRNYWNNFSNTGGALTNGTIGYLHDTVNAPKYLPYWCGGDVIPAINTRFISDSNEDFGRLSMDKTMILTGEKGIDSKLAFKLSKNEKTKGLVPMEFTFGYAITCHKSQGSEWPNVLVIEERFPFNIVEHARWLYTAVTRASDKVVIVKK